MGEVPCVPAPWSQPEHSARTRKTRWLHAKHIRLDYCAFPDHRGYGMNHSESPKSSRRDEADVFRVSDRERIDRLESDFQFFRNVILAGLCASAVFHIVSWLLL